MLYSILYSKNRLVLWAHFFGITLCSGGLGVSSDPPLNYSFHFHFYIGNVSTQLSTVRGDFFISIGYLLLLAQLQ